MSADSAAQLANLAARAAREGLPPDSYRFIDGGPATRAVDLFGADPVFAVRGAAAARIDEIHALLTAREAAVDRRTRHRASNFRLELEHATAGLAPFHANRRDNSVLELEAVVNCETRSRKTT